MKNFTDSIIKFKKRPRNMDCEEAAQKKERKGVTDSVN